MGNTDLMESYLTSCLQKTSGIHKILCNDISSSRVKNRRSVAIVFKYKLRVVRVVNYLIESKRQQQ